MDKFILKLESEPERCVRINKLNKEKLAYYIDFCLERRRNLQIIYEHALECDKVSILKRLPDDFDFFNPEYKRLVINSLCRGFVDVFDFLREKGLDLNLTLEKRPVDSPRYLLSCLLSCIDTPGCLDIAIKLIDGGVSITANDRRTKLVVRALSESDSIEIFDRFVIIGFDLHYFHHQMWKDRLLSPMSGTRITGRLYDMGFPIPLSVAKKAIGKIITSHEKAASQYRGTHHLECNARRINQLLRGLDVLWKLYGEDKNKILEIPPFE